MSLFALILSLFLLVQDSFADHSKHGPRGEERPFQIGPPIPSAQPPTYQSSGAALNLASASDSHSLAPVATAANSNPEAPYLPTLLDGDSLQLLPHPAASSSPRISSTSLDQPQRLLFMGYYPDWAGEDFPPEKIDFSRYDWVDFAFALPDSQFRLTWDSDSGPDLLRRVVAGAHSAGAKVKLSVGGWTGSKHFSPAVASPESRQIFADNIAAMYSTYGLDGIDIDWEYPGRPGNKGNIFGPQDTSNFLSFLKILRTVLPASACISAAVQTLPFAGTNGEPLTDTSEFALYLDWILIMNYDTWGSSSSPGPNAPLYDACKNSSQPEGNALAGFQAWSKSGFPASRMVLGLPSYGYVQQSTAQRLRTRWFHGMHHWDHGGKDPYDDDEGEDNQSNGSPSGSPQPISVTDDDSQIQFRDLVDQGALILQPTDANSSVPRYQGAGGFERRWDGCSDTPFLRSTYSGQVVTYDDPESLALKARFAKEVGMLGTNMFDIHGDTDEYHLADTIRRAMGP